MLDYHADSLPLGQSKAASFGFVAWLCVGVGAGVEWGRSRRAARRWRWRRSAGLSQPASRAARHNENPNQSEIRMPAATSFGMLRAAMPAPESRAAVARRFGLAVLSGAQFSLRLQGPRSDSVLNADELRELRRIERLAVLTGRLAGALSGAASPGQRFGHSAFWDLMALRSPRRLHAFWAVVLCVTTVASISRLPTVLDALRSVPDGGRRGTGAFGRAVVR